MPEVVDSNTAVYPRTMTWNVSISLLDWHIRRRLLIVPRNTPPAPFTMLGPDRHPIHAVHAEILIVELPEAKQFFDNRLLLASTTQLWHIAWVLKHAERIEVHAETKEDTKENI